MNQLSLQLFEELKLDMPFNVIYIENYYNAKVNSFIKSNLQLITDEYYSQNINFIYIPFLLKSEEYIRIFNYNYPYLNIDFNEIYVFYIYNAIINKYDLSINNCNLILIESDDLNNILLNKEIDLSSSLIDQFKNFPSEIINYLSIRKQKNETPFGSIRFNLIYSSCDIIEDEFSIEYDETEFEQEINKSIEKLINRGAIKLIGQAIEKLQNATQKLSILIITNEYRIFLKDYGMKEVIMSPLPKSLYMLFLNYPNGIPFKRLSEYQDELLSIYRNITNNDSLEQPIESIKAMTNPLNNSVNEKCSRIRASFLKVIPDCLAINYYITGSRGEPKRIVLDPSLVHFQ